MLAQYVDGAFVLDLSWEAAGSVGVPVLANRHGLGPRSLAGHPQASTFVPDTGFQLPL